MPNIMERKNVVLLAIGLMMLTLSFVLAQGTNGYNISPRCGSQTIEVDYAYKTYDDHANYYAVLTAGRCEQIIRGKIEGTGDVQTKIEANIKEMITTKNLRWQPVLLPDTSVTGRGSFDLQNG